MQSRYPMIGQEFELAPEVQKIDRGEGAWLRQVPCAGCLYTGIEVFRQEAGDVFDQGRCQVQVRYSPFKGISV